MRRMSALQFIAAMMLLTWMSGSGTPEKTELWVDAASKAVQENGSQQAPYKTIAKALSVAPKDGFVRVLSGEYVEHLTLSEGITLRGEGSPVPVVRASDTTKPVITMRGKAAIESLRITGGRDGLYVHCGTQARVVNCEILDNAEDGIGFEPPSRTITRPANVHIEGCLVSGNKDGIDLEGTEGIIRGCRLVRNGDDGLDYDGDTDCAAIDNEISENKDDGIEIRLNRRTIARIEGNHISGNGEDGIEIINTPIAGETSNQVEIRGNVIRRNLRYGIGGVHQKVEEVTPGLRILGVRLLRNVVEENGRGQIAGLHASEDFR